MQSLNKSVAIRGLVVSKERKGKEADLYSAYCQYLEH